MELVKIINQESRFYGRSFPGFPSYDLLGWYVETEMGEMYFLNNEVEIFEG